MGTQKRIRADALARWIFGIAALALVVIIVWLLVGLVRNMMSGDWGGGDVVNIPDVTGMEEQAAIDALQSYHLIGRVNQRSYNNDFPQGQVYRQNPAAGSRSKTGRKVNLLLSLGPANFVVPDLIGKQYGEAGQLILDAGLAVGKARKVYTTRVPAGQVLNQTPSPGEVKATTVPVDLTVADRSDAPVSVPAVVGSSIQAAEDLLARRNLHLSQVNYIESLQNTPGTVLGQSLASDSQVSVGSKISLDVAVEPEIKHALTRSFSFSIQMPQGPPKQQVKIKVFDNLAPKGKVVYDEEHPPGYQIERRIDVEGPATLMVFIGDMNNAYRTDKI